MGTTNFKGFFMACMELNSFQYAQGSPYLQVLNSNYNSHLSFIRNATESEAVIYNGSGDDFSV